MPYFKVKAEASTFPKFVKDKVELIYEADSLDDADLKTFDVLRARGFHSIRLLGVSESTEAAFHLQEVAAVMES